MRQQSLYGIPVATLFAAVVLATFLGTIPVQPLAGQDGAGQDGAARGEFAAELLHEFQPEEAVRDVLFSPFGDFLATSSYYGTVTLYDTDFEGQWERKAPAPSEGRDPMWDTWMSPIEFSRDGERLFIGNYTRRGDLGVVATRTKEEVARLSVSDSERVRDITLSADGALLAVATSSRVSLWSVSEDLTEYEQTIGEARWRAKDDAGSPGFREVRLSPDGAVMAVELSAGYIVVYTLAPEPFSNTQYLPPVPAECRADDADFETTGGCTPGSAYGFRFSPDGSWLVVGTERDGLVFWRRRNNDEFERVRAESEPPYDTPGGFAFGGASRTLVTGEDEALRVWRRSSGDWSRAATLTPQGHHGRLDLSPHGTYLAAGTAFSYLPEFSTRTELVDPAVRIWRLTGVGPTPGARVADIVGGTLSPTQKEILTEERARSILAAAGEDMLAPRGMFETEAEYRERRENLRREVKARLQELTEERLGVRIREHGDGRGTLSVPLSARGTYDIDSERYTVPVLGQEAELRLERDAARALYRSWKKATVQARRVPDVAGWDYLDFTLEHPEIGAPIPITLPVNPFTGERIDAVVQRRPVAQVGPHLELRDLRFQGIFPALYRHYASEAIGSVVVANTGSTTISDVELEVSIPALEGTSTTVPLEGRLGIDESSELSIPADLGRSLLERSEGDTVSAELTVSYVAGGEGFSHSLRQPVRVMNRNAIRWDDDRKVAAFMSVNDSSVARFATGVAGMVDDRTTSAMTRNLLYAMRFYEAIRARGTQYVVDPRSAYEELSRDELAIDHLRFPAETLSYGAGDCDDLSVLFNTLLESVGVATAFITTPGHIFAAFDLGVPPERARELYSTAGDLIIRDGTAWVPVETTLLTEGFLDAWRTGARQWRTAVKDETAGFFTTAEAWSEYQPVGIDLTVSVDAPNRDTVVAAYEEQLDEFREREVDYHTARLSGDAKDAATLTRLGLTYVRYGYLERGLSHFERAIAEGPALAAVLNAAAVSSQLDRHEEALSYLERAQELEPEHPRIQLGLAVSQLEAGKTREARSSYRRLADMAPRLADRYPLFAAAGESDGGRAGGERAVDSYYREGLMEPQE